MTVELLDSYQGLQKLDRITEQIASGLTMEELLANIYDSFREFLPYDRLGCALLESDGHTARAVWARSTLSKLYLNRGYSANLDHSSLRAVIDSGCPRILNDLEAYLRDHPASDSTRLIVREGIRSSLTCPLMASGKPIGFLFFSSLLPYTYDETHTESYLRVASRVSVIVEKTRLYQRLLEASQLKERIHAMVLHDVRNPLATLLGFIDILDSDDWSDAEERKSILDTMRRCCSSSLGFVDELMSVQALESGRLRMELAAVPMASFLRDWADARSVLARRRGIQLQLRLGAELPTVVLDVVRITQALNNLLDNAIKASFGGAAIVITARHRSDSVAIGVHDRGVGISAERLPHLFSATRPQGLGLRIVDSIVRAHGGHIQVRSRPGHGSSFVMTLPRRGPVAPIFHL